MSNKDVRHRVKQFVYAVFNMIIMIARGDPAVHSLWDVDGEEGMLNNLPKVTQQGWEAGI